MSIPLSGSFRFIEQTPVSSTFLVFSSLFCNQRIKNRVCTNPPTLPSRLPCLGKPLEYEIPSSKKLQRKITKQ